ncbi:MAG: HEAT repeat domain-containing protein [Anaerolineae bacterium]
MVAVNRQQTSLEELLELIYSQDWNERASAARRLVRFGPTIVAQLIKASQSERSEVRYVAAWTLGEIITDASTEALCQLVQTERDWAVREVAVRSLGRHGCDTAEKALVRVSLNAPSKRVRRAALDTVARLLRRPSRR